MYIKSQRIDEIKNYIYLHKTVTLPQLCENFNISMSTLRRDIDEVLQDHNFKKIYGGITVQQKGLLPFDVRNIANRAAKERIASEAAQFVEDGDIIFIDSGTTTLHMFKAIKDRENITILTNNLDIIIQAIPYENIKIISLSGVLNRYTLSFSGAESAKVLENYNISKAFMATTGFSIKIGVTNSSPLETALKQYVVQRSRLTYLLADSSKNGIIALMTYCTLDEIDALITDAPPSDSVCQYMEQHGSQIIVAR